MHPTYGVKPENRGRGAEKSAREPNFPATVVYIHPQRRYFTLKFELPRGRTCCESFYFANRQGAATPGKEEKP